MMRRLLFVFACLLLSRPLSYSQAVCGFDAAHAQKMAADPSYASRVQQSVSNWIGNQALSGLSRVVYATNGTFYEIPVVIHVIRPNAAATIDPNTNPSDAQLAGMINYLNQSYAAQYAGYPDTNNGGVAFPVKFVLAKRDPNCAATTGILRIDGSGLPNYVSDGITNAPATTPGEADANVKALSNWPVSRYYNIYVVNKIDGQNTTTGPYTAGYAFFPNGSNTDGTVILGSSAKAGEETLPHEMGHAFSLYHTFQGDGGGSTCPTNVNCQIDGDLVCDTDPHKRSPFNCTPGAVNPCTNLPYGNVVNNFMDYSICTARRFTPGQRDRFVFSLLNDRPGLAYSLGAVAPTMPTTAAACIPTAASPAGTLNAGPVKVTFADITSQSQGGYITDGNIAYNDLTCAYTGNLRVGSTYPISILTTSANSKVRVWIDMNNNGLFTDAGEQILNVGNNANNVPTFNGSFTVPATIATCTPLRMRVIVERSSSTNIGSCAVLQNGQAEDYTIYVRQAIADPVVSLAPGSTNPSCANTPLTFNVTPPAAATNLSYVWYVNNTLQASTTASFTSSALITGDRVRAWVKFSDACGPDSLLSNSITIQRGTNVVSSVSLLLTAGSNPGCPGQSLTFTAFPVNGGTTPTYTFRVNGIPVQSSTSITYTTTTLSNNSVVTVQMNGNSTCASPAIVYSGPVTITFGIVNSSVTFTQTGGPVPACAVKPVTYTATPVNGGTAPAYNWLLNGVSVQNGSNASFTYPPVNGDMIRVVLTSSNPCVSVPRDTSTTVTLAVDSAMTPTATIALTRGSNPGCRDSLLEFTGTAANLGAMPSFAWYVNGAPVKVANPFSTSTLRNGDVVSAVAFTPTNTPGCRVVDTATSGLISLQIDTAGIAPLISYTGNNLIANSRKVQWFGPNGKIAGATDSAYHPKEQGYYYAVSTSGVCPSEASNVLLISTITVGNIDLNNFTLSPNPTTGAVTLAGKGLATLRSVDVYNSLGMRVLSAQIENGVQSKIVSMEQLANGTYFFVLRNTAGAVGTMPVILRR